MKMQPDFTPAYLNNDQDSDGMIIGKHSCFVIDQCHSSMDVAWRLHQKGNLPEWGSVLALSQNSGRGQLGREWISPKGNVYGTLRLAPSALLNNNLLPLITGYALVKSLGLVGVKVKLKWPNDLVINNKKVGGILIEQKGSVCMAGVGINITSCPLSELRSQYALAAVCLKELGHDFEPFSLWLHLVKTGQDFFKRIIEDNAVGFMAEIYSYLAFIDKIVWVDEYKDKPYKAKIRGISPNGGLKVDTGRGKRVVRSASISPLVTL